MAGWCGFSYMSEPEKKSSFKPNLFAWGVVVCLLGLFAFVAIPNHVSDGRNGPGGKSNACINNLRQIDAAKNEWALEHDSKSNDIRPYIERERNNPFIKLDAKGNLPKCPSGGIYSIGKIGEPPTCSLGTTVTPAHVLP
jgi:general secretion pathway protein G